MIIWLLYKSVLYLENDELHVRSNKTYASMHRTSICNDVNFNVLVTRGCA